MGWLACVLAAGCGGTEPARDAVATIAPTGVKVTLTQANTDEPPTRFITDRSLVGGGSAIALRHVASPALFGWTSPLGVPSPDGRRVAYNAWRELDKAGSGRPSIRLLGLASGRESLIANGAYSVAWRADGAIAYANGDRRDVRAGRRYTTDVVVRRSPGARPRVWLERPGRYSVIAWAGPTLLAYATGDGEYLEVLAIDGPRSVRELADGSLVAVSPDGTRAVFSDGSAARLIDIAGGDVLARVRTRLVYGGSWVGDRIVAESPGGLVVLDASNDKLAVQHVLKMPRKAFPLGVHEPQFADASGARVVAWAPVPGRGGRGRGRLYVFVDCTIATATCSVGRPRGDRVFSHVYSPSRP